MSDRLVVDGSAWSGDGLDRLGALSEIVAQRNLGGRDVAVSDFAMLRQSRWREAIASSFDRPELRPFLGGVRELTVRYAAHPGAGTGGTNLIKPLYHVAWLASRLRMAVAEPLRAAGAGSLAGDRAGIGIILAGTLRAGRRRVPVRLVPVESPMPAGTTLAVEIDARGRSGTLEVAVTAEADAVIVRATLDGRSMPAAPVHGASPDRGRAARRDRRVSRPGPRRDGRAPGCRRARGPRVTGVQSRARRERVRRRASRSSWSSRMVRPQPRSPPHGSPASSSRPWRRAASPTGRRRGAPRRAGSIATWPLRPTATTCRGRQVHLWWGDDRWVPEDDILSNALACWDLLLRDVPVPESQVHVMPIGEAMAGGHSPAWVAERYDAELRAADLPLGEAGFPILDIILVGIGSDGHLFSVFPGSPTWDRRRLGPGGPGAVAHRPARRAGDAPPAADRRRTPADGRRVRDVEGSDRRPGVRAARGRAPAAGTPRATARRGLDPRHRGGGGDPGGDPHDERRVSRE